MKVSGMKKTHPRTIACGDGIVKVVRIWGTELLF
jgi:hypothetical protein